MKEKMIKKIKKWGVGSFVIGIGLMLFYGILGIANLEAAGTGLLIINGVAIIGLFFTAFGAGILFSTELLTMGDEK